MTRNSAKKHAVRQLAVATGQSYTAALRLLDLLEPETVPGWDCLCSLSAEFVGRGWPVRAPFRAGDGSGRLFAGPGQVVVRPRTDPSGPGFSATFVTPLTAALEMTVRNPVRESTSAHAAGTVLPLDPDIRAGAQVALNLSGPVADMVNACDEAVRIGRQQALTHAAHEIKRTCSVCRARYPARNLLYGRGFRRRDTPLPVCPACWLDEDYPWEPDADDVGEQFTEWFTGDLGTAAAWTGIAAIITTLAASAIRDAEHPGVAWDTFDWCQTDRLWVWLPEPDLRPAALRRFGVGAGLGAIVAALATDRPALMDEVVAANVAEYEGTDAEPPNFLLPQLWPAVVALALTLTTQTADHPDRRSPWHIRSSITGDGGALGMLLDSLDLPDIDVHDAEYTLALAADLAGALGLPMDPDA